MRVGALLAAFCVIAAVSVTAAVLSAEGIMSGPGVAVAARAPASPDLPAGTARTRRAQATTAAWCGDEATQDRPQIVTGRVVHAVYAYPSDVADRFSEIAPQMQADVESIDTWWRSQDPTRALRFDLASYPCGSQLDITSLRLPEPAAAYYSITDRYFGVRDALVSAGLAEPWASYLVYVDGPVEYRYCGQGFGQPESGPGFAMVYLLTGQGCEGNDLTAVHEVIHSLGVAQFSVGATHRCVGDEGHVCDSTQDVMYPGGRRGLFDRVLDYGHDDYYAHDGTWYDMQDSPWLRRPAQARISVDIQGTGTVESDVPGLSCPGVCQSDWDLGIPIRLSAEPGDGQRLVRWEGSALCIDDFACDLPVDGPVTVTALFAPETFPLSLAVNGKGTVTSPDLASPCRKRCRVAATSYVSLALRAKAARGWRFRRWGGGCTHTRLVCTLTMTGPSSARATFVRR